MKIYGLIPARSGSKGIKDKNIFPIKGFPLLSYSIVASKSCKKIDKTYITTDDYEYAQIADKFDVDDVIKRPNYLSTDTSMDIDYLLHFVYTKDIKPEDYIVLLRPTTPLRNSKSLDIIIEKFISNNRYESLRSLHKTNVIPEKTFTFRCKKGNNSIEPYIGIDHIDAYKPRQSYDKCYDPNGYIDIIKVSTIINTKTAYGTYVFGYETEYVQEIDSKDDIKYIEYQIEKFGHPIYDYLNKIYGHIKK